MADSSIPPTNQNNDSVDSDSQKTQDQDSTLNHTPVLSDNFELFSHDHEHRDAQEKNRKRNAVIAFASGVTALFALGIVGFFSANPSSTENFHASAVDISKIPYSVESAENFESCKKIIEKKSSTEIERKKGEEVCASRHSRAER